MAKVTLANVGSLIDVTSAEITINNNTAAIVAAFDDTISRSGENPNQMTSNLDMNSNRIINTADGVLNKDAVNVSQLNAITTSAGNVPVGGATAQVLTKNSNTNYDTIWATPSAGGSSPKGIFGGRLTNSIGKIRPLTDITSSTIYYCPNTSDSLLVQGVLTNFLTGPTDQNGWSLNIGGLGTGMFHVCANSTGLYTIAGATVLTRYQGILVDPALNNPYLGSIYCSVAGQVTCHLSADFNRKWEVYNNYSKMPVTLTGLTQERDIAYNPRNQYNTTGFQAFNNNTNNKINIFTGLEEDVRVEWNAQAFMNSLSGPYGIIVAIGWNSPSNTVGRWAGGTIDDSVSAKGASNNASYRNSTAVGLNVAYMSVAAAVNSASTLTVIDSSETPVANKYEAGRDCIMYANWLG